MSWASSIHYILFLIFYYCNIHFSSCIHLPELRSQSGIFPWCFQAKMVYQYVRVFLILRHATHFAYQILYNLIILTMFEKCTNYKDLIKQFFPFSCYFHYLGLDMFLSTSFSDFLNLCSSLGVGKQVWDPYKHQAKLFILLWKQND